MGVSRDSPNFLCTPIISGTRKATNFKFGRYIHRVHPNTSQLKIWEKRERGRMQIIGVLKKFGQSLDTPMLPFLTNFSWAFVRMDSVNIPAKFEVSSFTRS